MIKKVISYKTKKYPLEKGSKLSACYDIRAWIKRNVILNPGERKIIPTGIFLKMPNNYEAQIRSRSGLAAKHGIVITNSPGTIDADYQDEVKLIVSNTSKASLTIKPGDRVAQICFRRIRKHKVKLQKTLNYKDNDRKGGLGSTGIS